MQDRTSVGNAAFEVLAENQDVPVPPGLVRLCSLTDPANYLESAAEVVDQVHRGTG